MTTIPYRGRTTLLTLGVPAAITASAVAVAWSWRGELPDPIAVHWGTHGPDGFGSLTPNVVIPAIACMVVAGLLWALGFFAGRQSFTRRGAAAGAIWLTTLLEGVSIGGLSVQRGVADAREAGSITGAIVIAFVIATAAAGVAILLSPGDPPQPTTESIPDDATRLPLGENEQASWIREVLSPGYHFSLAATVVAVALVVIFTGEWALALLLGVVLGFSFVAFMHFVVTVNRDGLTVRSALGRPRFRVPLDEVIKAEVVEVRPIREFGGFGIRGDGHGRIGVVIRTGEMLQVHRTGDRIFVVTVDDAATGAALLNTLASRARR
jgi:hypothetical protein